MSSRGARACLMPAGGVWRVGRAPDPLARPMPVDQEEASDPHSGNRFDSPDGSYDVLYFATALEGCFGETLSRFRPDPRLAAMVRQEWAAMGVMAPGAVPAEWRHHRLAVKAEPMAPGWSFLDVEHLDTRTLLRSELGEVLAEGGFGDLDVAAIRGPNRVLTREVSRWAYAQQDAGGAPRYGGVRYQSRISSAWECWALFVDRVPLREVERRGIERDMEALSRVARDFGLMVF